MPSRDLPSASDAPSPAAAPSPTGTTPQVAARPDRWSSERLFDGRTEIEITHGVHIYRLRQTSLGKLILTK